MNLPVENPENQGIVLPLMSQPDPARDLSDLLASAEKHLYPNYAQPPLVMSHGKGGRLFDTSGKSYIDFFAGIAVCSLGHGHPRLVAALSRQVQQLIHVSNYFYTAPNLKLAEKLCQLSGYDRAFFCNSGTEANEAALKMCRRSFFEKGQTERDIIIAFDNSFHGRTLGALTATGQKKYREGFGPIAGVLHVPYGDLEALRGQMNDRVAGVIYEPIQGEGGVIPAPDGFLQGMRELCDLSGALLIADEIQTGVGRTGTFLCSEQAGVRPDIVSLAKGLGGGFPIGALLCTERLAGALPKGSHGTTFGGNPLASTAALTVLEVLSDEHLMDDVKQKGATLTAELDELVKKHSCLSARRGQGLLQGLVLKSPEAGPEILSTLREAGVLVTFCAGTTLRITPPLTITNEELVTGLGLLDQVLGGQP